MKIFFRADSITYNCKTRCPFADIGVNGKTGGDCQVGSIRCQECSFCYGLKNEGYCLVPDDKDELKVEYVRYVQCMFDKKYTLPYKVLRFFFWFKNNYIRGDE